MKKDNQPHFITSQPDYKKAIREKKDFFIQFHVLTKQVESVIIKIILRYLEEYDILYMKNPIINIIKELMNNAVKANIKRLYFKQKNLDIKKETDYKIGMESFKSDAYNQNDTGIFEALQKSEMYVRVLYKRTKKDIHINVINNTPILDSELEKVKTRISSAFKYNDISEAFEDVIDDSEGAGLGLIMAMMLFKNSGLSANSFNISKDKNQTITTISIPQKMVQSEATKRITEEIIREVNEIPSIPDNISKIRKLCDTPAFPMKKIAEAISLDPGLTAQILKIANSPGYAIPKKTNSIEEAVKNIGKKGMNSLLVASGVTKIISGKYKKYEIIWNRSNKRAFYAKQLANKLKLQPFSHQAYLAGLLVDLGMIVLLSIDSDMINKLKVIAGFKGIEDTNLLEEISLGLSHSSLGAMICEKWKFDISLIKAVEFHHRPYMSPKNYKHLIFIVYLAEIFIEIEENKNRFETIDEDVLSFFKLNDQKKFETLHKGLKKSYNK